MSYTNDAGPHWKSWSKHPAKWKTNPSHPYPQYDNNAPYYPRARNSTCFIKNGRGSWRYNRSNIEKNNHRYHNNERNSTCSRKNADSPEGPTGRNDNTNRCFPICQQNNDNVKQPFKRDHTMSFNDKKLLTSKSGWYDVRLKFADQYDSWEYVKNLIIDYVQPMTFKYYNKQYLVQENEYSFYVCDFELAQKLYNSGWAISTCTHEKLIFWVTSTSPKFDITSSMNLVGAVISKRYDPDRNHLDLSMLQDDPDLLEKLCFLPLDRPCAIKYVFTIISSTLPDLRSINLNSNRLFLRDSLRTVAISAPLLKIVHLENNHIKKIEDLVGLSLLNLQELHLAGNLIFELSKDYEKTKTEILEMFPTLINLDGVEVDSKMPKPVLLPTIRSSFVCTDDAKLFLRNFISSYFELYDATCRQSLESFYHRDAQFSLIAIDSNGQHPVISSLIKSSRNLVRVKDEERQKGLLFTGRTNIINFLNKLPNVRHDPGSLSLDCPIMSPSLIHVSISGLYEILDPMFLNCGKNPVPISKTKNLIVFSRAFVFLPDDNKQFLISREQLHVTNASTSQYIKAFVSLHGLESFDQEYDKKRINMHVQQPLNWIKKLSLAKGISLNYAEDLLKKVDWNYDRALETK